MIKLVLVFMTDQVQRHFSETASCIMVNVKNDKMKSQKYINIKIREILIYFLLESENAVISMKLFYIYAKFLFIFIRQI